VRDFVIQRRNKDRHREVQNADQSSESTSVTPATLQRWRATALVIAIAALPLFSVLAAGGVSSSESEPRMWNLKTYKVVKSVQKGSIISSDSIEPLVLPIMENYMGQGEYARFLRASPVGKIAAYDLEPGQLISPDYIAPVR